MKDIRKERLEDLEDLQKEIKKIQTDLDYLTRIFDFIGDRSKEIDLKLDYKIDELREEIDKIEKEELDKMPF